MIMDCPALLRPRVGIGPHGERLWTAMGYLNRVGHEGVYLCPAQSSLKAFVVQFMIGTMPHFSVSRLAGRPSSGNTSAFIRVHDSGHICRIA